MLSALALLLLLHASWTDRAHSKQLMEFSNAEDHPMSLFIFKTELIPKKATVMTFQE